MKRRIIIIIMFLAIFKAYTIYAYPIMSGGFYGGFMPGMGGSLHSYQQSNNLGNNNGINGINRTLDGKDTNETDRLLGAAVGADFRAIFFNYSMIRIGANYVKSFYGGEGKTLDLSDEIVTTNYSIWVYDFPVTIGLSIPFWKDVRLSLSGGIAVAYGSYSNRFKSATFNSSATFKGWALPLVIILSGEHFLTNSVSLTSAITYYKGSTKIRSGGSDYARIDFTGYRWTMGISMYYDFNLPVKK